MFSSISRFQLFSLCSFEELQVDILQIISSLTYITSFTTLLSLSKFIINSIIFFPTYLNKTERRNKRQQTSRVRPSWFHIETKTKSHHKEKEKKT
jgi:hypothetical protein